MVSVVSLRTPPALRLSLLSNQTTQNQQHLSYNDRRTYNSERAFILFLCHFRKGIRLTTMANEVFGGDARQ